MKQFICHQSALEYWRRRRKLPESSADRRYRVALPNKPLEIELQALPSGLSKPEPQTIPNKLSKPKPQTIPNKLSKHEPKGFQGLSSPVHIMIGAQEARRVSRGVKQHVFSSETPVGCFINVGGGLMVSSPEFCFLQMAERLKLFRLIELGYELCGAYSIPVSGDQNVPERGFYNREPLTSINKLNAFLDGMPGAKGRQKAMRALRYMCDGSASPMETILAMFLTLPYNMGGFRFELPELNKRIVLTKTARKYFNKEYYVCDLFWSNKKIAVEYDSDQQHTGSDRIASDSKRRNVLDSSGIRVVSVTKQQLYSGAELERAARTIAKHMGRRLRIKESNFYAAHNELREQLLDQESFH